MPRDDDESESVLDAVVRVRRARGEGAPFNPPRYPSFLDEIQAVLRRKGNYRRWLRGWKRARTGGFNARGRGAKVAAALSSHGEWGWQTDSAGRFRARRVIVKSKIVQLNPRRGATGAKVFMTTSRGVDAYLRYLKRDGITQDGELGKPYSSLEDEADGKAFLVRGRQDRHQFRFIVSPEDSIEMADLRGFTRDLMCQMEKDLNTRLDWIAVDHHNTGHPHTHILLRGVLDNGRILYIAGNYITRVIRHRASDLITRELGHQRELELETKLQHEVGADRVTRLDEMLLDEQRERDVIDLRPGQAATSPVRENRNLIIGRVRHLKSFLLAAELEPGRWSVCDDLEDHLKAIAARDEAIMSIQRAVASNGLEEERWAGHYLLHGEGLGRTIVGQVLAKGRAGNEMDQRISLVVDGVDGWVHHMVLEEASRIAEVERGMIVEAAPVVTEPRPDDRNIAANAAEDDGLYQPSRHLARIHDSFERQGKDPEAFVRAHVRRLQALLRVHQVERVDADCWKIPKDIVARGQIYGNGLRIRTLSALSLEQQIGSEGATWLDRQLTAPDRSKISDSSLGQINDGGFGHEVNKAMWRRAKRLLEMGLATASDGSIHFSSGIVETLERREVDRFGLTMARESGLVYVPSEAGDYVRGRLTGMASLVSGRFAMIENGLTLELVPWHPSLEKRIGHDVAGLLGDDGGIEWERQRERGLSL